MLIGISDASDEPCFADTRGASHRGVGGFTSSGGASLVGVSGWIESPPVMVFRLSSNRNSVLVSNSLLGGLFSEGKRMVTLDFVPRLVGPSLPIPFLEVVQVGALGFGVLG